MNDLTPFTELIGPDVKAILFDFDGVIAESVDVKTDAFSELYKSFGQDIVEKVAAHHIVHGGISRFQKIKHYHKEFLGIDITEDELQAWCRRFSNLVLQKVIDSKFVNGMPGILTTLSEKYILFVVSGTPEDELKHIVEIKALNGYFKEVYGAPKTKPEIIRLILKDEGMSTDEAVYVGDSISDYKASQETGAGFIGRVGKGIKNPFPEGIKTIESFRA